MRSADRLSDAAIFFGSVSVKTPRFRSSASLSRVTRCDQRFDLAEVFFRVVPVFRLAGRVLRPAVFRILRAAVLRRSAMNNSFAFQPKPRKSAKVPWRRREGNSIADATL